MNMMTMFFFFEFRPKKKWRFRVYLFLNKKLPYPKINFSHFFPLQVIEPELSAKMVQNKYGKIGTFCFLIQTINLYATN